MTKNTMNKKIEVNIPNKVFYSLVAIVAIIVIGVGVYAYNYPGTPNVMGHTIGEINPPYQCNGYLKYDSTNGWTCGTPSGGTSNPTVTCTGTNKGLQWTGSSWVCATYTSTGGTCNWAGWNDPCGTYNEQPLGTICEGGYSAIKSFCSYGEITQTDKVVCCPLFLPT